MKIRKHFKVAKYYWMNPTNLKIVQFQILGKICSVTIKTEHLIKGLKLMSLQMNSNSNYRVNNRVRINNKKNLNNNRLLNP